MPERLQNFNWKQRTPKIDVERYLRRAGYEALSLPTLDYLKKLHKNHLLSIPFENLDIHWQRQIVLEIEKIYEKIVLSKRGGFCYELNGLFYALLLNLGFSCRLISCRVYNDKGEESADYDHMAIIVDLEGDLYLADVGFGELFLEPKKIVLDHVLIDYNKYFKFSLSADNEFILSSSSDASSFKREYIFSTETKQFIEFMPRCDWQQTSKDSHFTQNKVCSIATAEGRISLTSDKLIKTVKGVRQETKLLNADDFNSKLKELFGISHSSSVGN